MSEPSLVSLVWFAFKDALLLTRFVFLTVVRIQHRLQPALLLDQGFRLEYHHVQSFGRCFLLENDEMRRNKEISEATWFYQVKSKLEAIRTCYGEYAKLAQIGDPVYKRYNSISDLLGEEVDFILPLELRDEPHESLKLIDNTRVMDRSFWWADARLQTLLGELQACTERLMSLVPLIMAAHPRFRQLPGHPAELFKFMATEDARCLGANTHLAIRGITMGYAVQTDEAVYLKGRPELQLHTDLEAEGLCVGSLLSEGIPEPVLLEYKKFRRSNDPTKPIRGRNELFQLAHLLQKASSNDSDLPTLKFRGIIDESALKRRFAFVFDFPVESDHRHSIPVSLHHIISNHSYERTVSLPTRFLIAHTLAKAIVKFHADGWVHKNLRSHAVVFFRRKTALDQKVPSASSDSSLSYEQPYLVDFEYARPVNAGTDYIFPDLEHSIYRHPARQGLPSESFNKSHDIYALGVILLEIGLWRPASAIFTAYSPKGLPPTDNLPPHLIQDTFLHTVREKLLNRMGEPYARAVEACLNDRFRETTYREDAETIFVQEVVRDLYASFGGEGVKLID